MIFGPNHKVNAGPREAYFFVKQLQQIWDCTPTSKPLARVFDTKVQQIVEEPTFAYRLRESNNIRQREATELYERQLITQKQM